MTGTRGSNAARRTCAGILLTLLGACIAAEEERPDTEHAGAMRDSVSAMLDDVAASLAAEGPVAWLRFFEDSSAFLMASDGEITFPDTDSAAAFLASFARGVSGMKLTWDDVRIEPITPGVASFAAAYHESIRDTAGAVASFRGYVTGVARHTSREWRLQHLHWSSPFDTTR